MKYLLDYTWIQMFILALIVSLPAIGLYAFGLIGFYIGQGLLLMALGVATILTAIAIWEMVKEWMNNWDLLKVLLQNVP